jgi:hypothetical protein
MCSHNQRNHSNIVNCSLACQFICAFIVASVLFVTKCSNDSNTENFVYITADDYNKVEFTEHRIFCTGV